MIYIIYICKIIITECNTEDLGLLLFYLGEKNSLFTVSHYRVSCRATIVLLFLVIHAQLFVTAYDHTTHVKLKVASKSHRFCVSPAETKIKILRHLRRGPRGSRFHLCQLPSPFRCPPDGHKGKLRAAVRTGPIIHFYFLRAELSTLPQCPTVRRRRTCNA